ncbi:hypothetical protein HYW74_00350 [Candidatus Pacearchaeota archaeon]|nr:hypothetical protein [Candidatus Pacearchaeota archaeon]
MKLNKKRGVSDVITTVLMLLLIIAAIGILWLVIQNFVKKGTGTVEGRGDCLTTDLTVESAKINQSLSSEQLTVRIARAGLNSGNLSSINFYFDGSLKSATTSVWPQVGETKPYTITLSTADAASAVGKEVYVAAVIGDKTCPQSLTQTVVNATV